MPLATQTIETTASTVPQQGIGQRLTKGAGTHLASWLQEVDALSVDDAQALLDNSSRADSTPKGTLALAGLHAAHGKQCGHAKPMTDVAHSGDLLLTKDPKSMRMWRARGDFALLRVVTCGGKHVAVHPCGQFIVTGTRGAVAAGAATATDNGGVGGDDVAEPVVPQQAAISTKPPGGLKIWGPAGGSAYTVGKKVITRDPRKA